MEQFQECLGERKSEAELLLPWRMKSFGGWAKEYSVNPCWIRDGQTSETDCHSWLRSSQLQGRDVCIVGATRGICRVCVEAWNAGFKPVLVLLQDLIQEDVKEDLLRCTSQLQRCHYRSGLLHTAFEVLVVDSRHVSLRLDVEGQPMDVNVAAPHYCYPFQGPAIVLGDILRQDMLEDVHEKSLEAHRSRTREESAVVLDPRFWEARRDPECLPYAVMTYQTFVSACVLNVFQTMAVVAVYRGHNEAYFDAWRVLADLIFKLPASLGVCLAVGKLLLELPQGLSPFSFLMMWLYVLPGSGLLLLKIDGHFLVPDFMCAISGATLIVPFVLFYGMCLTKARTTKWAVLWYMAALAGTMSGWVIFVPLLQLYQLLLAHSGFVASIYLAVTFPCVEAMFVKFMSFCYTELVAKRRAEDPTSVPGDQKGTVSIAIYGFNTSHEAARLASLLSGAIVANDSSFLREVVVFTISSIAINTAVRTATVARFAIMTPIVGRFLCPTSIWAVNNNAKFTMGWGRFFSVLGVMLGRGFLHGQWETSMTFKPGVYSTWCWSGTVLVTVFLAFLAEVLEDALVFWLTRSGYPFPKTQRYEEIMWWRLKNPSTAARQHVCHYAIPQLADAMNLEDEDEEEDTSKTAAAVRLSKVGPSPGLTNQRVMDIYAAFLLTFNASILLMTNLSVGVGSGNLLGFCRPLNIKRDSFLLILRNAVLWDMQCEF